MTGWPYGINCHCSFDLILAICYITHDLTQWEKVTCLQSYPCDKTRIKPQLMTPNHRWITNTSYRVHLHYPWGQPESQIPNLPLYLDVGMPLRFPLEWFAWWDMNRKSPFCLYPRILIREPVKAESYEKPWGKNIGNSNKNSGPKTGKPNLFSPPKSWGQGPAIVQHINGRQGFFPESQKLLGLHSDLVLTRTSCSEMTLQIVADYVKFDDNSEPVFQEMPKGLDFSA